MTAIQQPEPLAASDAARIAAAPLGVLVFFTALDSYAFRTLASVRPSYLVLAFVAIAGVAILLAPRRPEPLLRSPLAAWLVFYFALTTVWAFWMNGTGLPLQILYDRYRSIAFLTACAILLGVPRAWRAAAVAVIAAVVLASALNLAEFARLVRFDIDVPGLERTAGRSAGLYVNPNESGVAITFGVALAITVVPRRLRVPLLVISGLGVLVTFSRGAMACFVLLCLWLLWKQAVGRLAVGLAAALLVGLFVRFSTAAPSLETVGLLNDNTVARLQMAKDDSGRGRLAGKAWRLFQRAPLTGNGIGSTVAWDEPVSSHNQYLNLAADHGVLGLLAFPALALALVLTGRRLAAFVPVLLLAGFFSHNLLEHRYALLAIALAATCPREDVKDAPGESAQRNGRGPGTAHPPARPEPDGRRRRAKARPSHLRTLPTRGS